MKRTNRLADPSLDALVRDPSLTATLSAEDRQRLLIQIAALLMSLATIRAQESRQSPPAPDPPAVNKELISPEELAKRLRYKNVESIRAVLRKRGPKDGVYRHGQRHIQIDWLLYLRRLQESKLGTDLE